METTANDEQSQKIQAQLDRSRELLSQADGLREKHAQLRSQFPQDFEPGAALSWLQENAQSNPKVAQALEDYEAWSRARPTPGASSTPSHVGGGHGRRNWQAI